jgi:hypothetical protein
VRFAYADPPYEGQAWKYAREARANGRRSREVDHPALIATLCDEFPDGWALSMKSNSLHRLLPLSPPGTRVLAWVKTFVPAYPNIRPIYSWEPVLLAGGRASEESRMVKDALIVGPQQGLHPRKTNAPLGAKPSEFCRWILDALGYRDGEDELVDLFPGTGIMGAIARQQVIA